MRQTDAIIGSRIHFATPVVICMAVDFSENIRSAYTPWNWNLMLNYVCKIFSAFDFVNEFTLFSFNASIVFLRFDPVIYCVSSLIEEAHEP